jgi:hypothetical protein
MTDLHELADLCERIAVHAGTAPNDPAVMDLARLTLSLYDRKQEAGGYMVVPDAGARRLGETLREHRAQETLEQLEDSLREVTAHEPSLREIEQQARAATERSRDRRRRPSAWLRFGPWVAAAVIDARKHVEVGGGRRAARCSARSAASRCTPRPSGRAACRRGRQARRTRTRRRQALHRKDQGGGLREQTTYDVDGFELGGVVEVRTPSGVVVGRAEAMCLAGRRDVERPRRLRVRSMAETRAESRAWRRAIGWLVQSPATTRRRPRRWAAARSRRDPALDEGQRGQDRGHDQAARSVRAGAGRHAGSDDRGGRREGTRGRGRRERAAAGDTFQPEHADPRADGPTASAEEMLTPASVEHPDRRPRRPSARTSRTPQPSTARATPRNTSPGCAPTAAPARLPFPINGHPSQQHPPNCPILHDPIKF